MGAAVVELRARSTEAGPDHRPQSRAIQSAASGLVLSSMLNALLGFVFWVLAARLFDVFDVGRGSAIVSGLTVVAMIANLGVPATLVRYLPTVRGAQRPLVLRAYAVAVAAGAAGGVLLAGVLHLVAPEVGTGRWWVVATLAVAGALHTVFAVQDAALVGTGRPWWVPVENGSFAVAKIALLVLAAVLVFPDGIWLGWSVAVAGAVLVVNVRLLPRLTAEPLRVDMLDLRRYARRDLATRLSYGLTQEGLALLVLALLGPELEAYYFVVMAISYPVWEISIHYGEALVANTAGGGAHLGRRNLASAIRWTAALASLAVVGALVLGDRVLSLFGPQYAENATTMLWLVMLAAVPGAVAEQLAAVARTEDRTAVMVRAEVLAAVTTAAAAVPLLLGAGLAGMGVAFVLGRLVSLVVLARSHRRSAPERITP